MATLPRGLKQLRLVMPTTAVEVVVKVAAGEEDPVVVVNLAGEVQTRDLEVVAPRSNRSLRSGGVGYI